MIFLRKQSEHSKLFIDSRVVLFIASGLLFYLSCKTQLFNFLHEFHQMSSFSSFLEVKNNYYLDKRENVALEVCV